MSVYRKGIHQNGRTKALNLFHEVGHIISLDQWGGAADPRWQPWQKAVRADPKVPSQYGNGRDPARILEDFADASALHLLSHHDPRLRTKLQRALPSRLVLLDRLWSGAHQTGQGSKAGQVAPAAPSKPPR